MQTKNRDTIDSIIIQWLKMCYIRYLMNAFIVNVIYLILRRFLKPQNIAFPVEVCKQKNKLHSWETHSVT